MLSRLRSSSGVPGRVMATCNPDANSWVKDFVQYWIDEKTGYPIEERDGKLRWFIRVDDKIVWGNSKKELVDEYGKDQEPMSVTFIRASIYDNKILMKKDPTYLSKLKSLDRVERDRLLGGNWNVTETAGMLFKKHYFEVVDVNPTEIIQTVRCWDRAATKVDDSNRHRIDPDYTVGVKLAKTRNGLFYILDVVRVRESPFEVERIILNTAKQDGIHVVIKIYQDPGSAGVYEADSMKKVLAGFIVESEKVITNKITNAKPVSAQAEAGNIKILRANWNEELFTEFENFPEGKHDDIVDAMSGAFSELTSGNVGNFSSEFLQDNQISRNDEW